MQKLLFMTLTLLLALPLYAETERAEVERAETKSAETEDAATQAAQAGVAKAVVSEKTVTGVVSDVTDTEGAPVAAESISSDSAAAPAAETSAVPAKKFPGVATQLPNTSAYLGQVIFGLVLVLGLIFAIAWLMRRFGNQHLLGSQHIKVVAALSLGARERVVLVDVGGEQLLLGVAPGRISCLRSFAEPVVVKTAPTGSSDFAQKLKEMLIVKR